MTKKTKLTVKKSEWKKVRGAVRWPHRVAIRRDATAGKFTDKSLSAVYSTSDTLDRALKRLADK